jgi:hypothetical protein
MKAFYLNLRQPHKEIQEVNVTIVQGKKKVWAKLPDGSLRLIGSSIFFTMPAAIRSQRSLLQTILKYQYAPWHKFGAPAAKNALKTIGYLQ